MSNAKQTTIISFILELQKHILKKDSGITDSDFCHRQYIKCKEISKYIWSIKDAGTPYTINWSIIAKVKGNAKINCCPLCFTEKYHLMKYFNDMQIIE